MKNTARISPGFLIGLLCLFQGQLQAQLLEEAEVHYWNASGHEQLSNHAVTNYIGNYACLDLTDPNQIDAQLPSECQTTD